MFHLSRNSQVFGSATCLTALMCIVGFTALATPFQSPPFEQHIPTTERSKITVSGVSNISITGWDKSEVSITGNASDKLNDGEVKISQSNDKVDILCHSQRPGKTISIALIVPAKAVVTVITDDGKIEIREPVKPTTIQLTDKIVDMNVPANSKLDLRDVEFAQWYQSIPNGYTTISVGGKVVGSGPPYFKLSKTKEPVTINRSERNKVAGGAGTIAPVPPRPLTIAAQMIALRGGVMGTSLRKSEPRLSELKKELPAGGTKNEDEAGDITLRSQLVNLNVTVTDRDGRSIAGLKQEDFTVYEDGVKQSIAHFAPEQSPFNLVLLLDMSGSVATKRDLIVQAALHFIDVIGPQDKVAVIVFTTDVLIISHLTPDREDLRDSITNLVFPTGGTSFYDALGYSLAEELRKVRKQRNAIVVLTDGEDNQLLFKTLAKPPADLSGPINITIGPGTAQMGSFLTFEQLLEGVRESDALIYPVHIDTNDQANTTFNIQLGQKEMADKISTTARSQLQELADASGGRVYNAEHIEDIAKIYDQVAAEMRTVYSLTYVPTNAAIDGKLRSIKVNVNRTEAVARTRPGYYPR